MLACGLNGYDAAQNKANQKRKQLGLKGNQVSFKSGKNPAETLVRQVIGKYIVQQPGYGKYAGTTPYASGVRIHFKDWDE